MERTPRCALKAGAAYFGLVFAVGWMLGPVRELWIIPRFGHTAGVLFEGPLLLAAMLASARWVIQRCFVSDTLATRLSIGLVATGFLVIAELLGIWWMRGVSLSGYLTTFDTVSGGVSALLILLFAAMPVLVERREHLFRRGAG